MKIRTYYNRDENDKTFATIEGISMTVPNMSFTIEELFEMHRNNLKLPIDEYVPFFNECDLEEFSPLREQGEDVIDWYNRLSDADRVAVIDTIAGNLRQRSKERGDGIESNDDIASDEDGDDEYRETSKGVERKSDAGAKE